MVHGHHTKVLSRYVRGAIKAERIVASRVAEEDARPGRAGVGVVSGAGLPVLARQRGDRGSGHPPV